MRRLIVVSNVPKITQLVCEGERIEKRGCEALELMFSPLPNTAQEVLLLQSLQELVAEGHLPSQMQAQGRHLCAPRRF